MIVTLVLLMAAAICSGPVSDGLDGGGGVSGLWALFAIPFQLAAMALLGNVQAGGDSFGVSLFAPPLLLTGLFVVGVFLLARRDEAFSAEGEATATYEADNSYGFGPRDWQSESDTAPFYLYGTIDLVDDELVVELED